MRITGLKNKKRLSSGSSLGGGGRLVSRKRIKNRSAKMQEIYETQRIPFVKDFLARNPQCAFVVWALNDGRRLKDMPSLHHAMLRHTKRCGQAAVDVHEIFPRGRGGKIVPIDGDESNFLPLCRTHHQFVTSEPTWAKEHGYSK